MGNENPDIQALQFVSNVIELKPDKKYLLIFKDMTHYQLDQIDKYLRARGFDCACINTHDQAVQIIEVPVSEALTTNERRATMGLQPLVEGRPLHDWKPLQAMPGVEMQHTISLDSIRVLCVTSNGDEMLVPLKTIWELFKKEMFEEIKYKGFRV
jgi:hypothetical protein